MSGRKISAIRIKQLAYANAVAEAPTKAKLSEAIAAATVIDNSHQDTFQYEEAEASVTKYKNQITGQVYRSDIEAGEVNIKFTIGSYDLATKAALQGGTGSDEQWVRERVQPIYKTLYAVTEDDVCIVFPKAQIFSRGASADNAIGLAVTATPLETDSAIGAEYWFDMI